MGKKVVWEPEVGDIARIKKDAGIGFEDMKRSAWGVTAALKKLLAGSLCRVTNIRTEEADDEDQQDALGDRLVLAGERVLRGVGDDDDQRADR